MSLKPGQFWRWRDPDSDDYEDYMVLAVKPCPWRTDCMLVDVLCSESHVGNVREEPVIVRNYRWELPASSGPWFRLKYTDARQVMFIKALIAASSVEEVVHTI